MDNATKITLNKRISILKQQRNNHRFLRDSLNGEPQECLSATSPLSYLADLIDYATKHIRKENGALTLEDLENYFHQPFGEIPLNCTSLEKEIPQIRICLEVLRQRFKDETPDEFFQTKEAEYLESVYSMFLLKLNTSVSELEGIANAEPEVRQNLADRLRKQQHRFRNSAIH